MKLLKLSSIFVLTLLFMGMTIPEAEAKHCKHHHHHCKRSKSSLGLSLNLGSPNYVVATPAAPAVVAAPVYQYPAAPVTYVTATPYAYPTYMAASPGYSYYQAPVYQAPVVLQNQTQSVYLQPGFSFTYRSH